MKTCKAVLLPVTMIEKTEASLSIPEKHAATGAAQLGSWLLVIKVCEIFITDLQAGQLQSYSNPAPPEPIWPAGELSRAGCQRACSRPIFVSTASWQAVTSVVNGSPVLSASSRR